MDVPAEPLRPVVEHPFTQHAARRVIPTGDALCLGENNRATRYPGAPPPAGTASCGSYRAVQSVTGAIGRIRSDFAQGVNLLRRSLPELLEDGENGLSDLFRRLLAQSYQQLQTLDGHIDPYTQEMKRQSQQDEACRRLQTIPGYGPIVAGVFHSVVGNGEAYRRGRDVSASLGLVPRQHSSGGKEVLLGISKRGDRYLRSLLVHGARSVVIRAAKKDDRLSRWINKVKAARGFNKAVVALANKMARIGWAVVVNKTVYQIA